MLANLRFRLRSAPIWVLVVTAVGFVTAMALVLSNSLSDSARLLVEQQVYIDPCMLVKPERLVHFDPPKRVSSEFETSAGIVPADVDPPSFNRIFAAFFDRYLFAPHSDVVIGINSTARGRPTDIRNGMEVAKRAIRILSGDDRIQIDKYTLGYEHIERVRGSRNVFHILTRIGDNKSVHEENTKSTNNGMRRHVVAIQRMFDSNCHVSVRDVPESSFSDPVYIVLPYSARPRRLTWFTVQFEELVLEEDVIARLVIAVLKQNATDVAHVQKLARESTASKFIEVVPVDGDRTSFFSRAIAIREAATLVPQESVMFISDVDMYVFSSMFDSCRYNSIRGSQVYFPVFYSLFPRNDRIARSGGYWRDSSLGMSCMYRSDFDHVEAYKDAENKFIGWGMEDRVLHEAFKNAEGYEVFRAVEPALRHKWHVKHCEPLTSNYEDCLSVTFQQLGDMKSVGKFMMEEQKMDTQKMFARFADDDDEQDGDIVKSAKNVGTDAGKHERFERRQELLMKSHEERKRREAERQRQKEMEWRRNNGISIQQNEEPDGTDNVTDSKVWLDDALDKNNEKSENQ